MAGFQKACYFLFMEFHVLGLNERCEVAGAELRQAPQAGGGQVPRLSSGVTTVAEYQALTNSNTAMSPPKPSVDDSARV